MFVFPFKTRTSREQNVCIAKLVIDRNYYHPRDRPHRCETTQQKAFGSRKNKLIASLLRAKRCTPACQPSHQLRLLSRPANSIENEAGVSELAELPFFQR